MDSPPPLSANRLGVVLLQSMWTEFAVTTLILAARLYTRTFLVRKVLWDDFLMISAYVVTLAAFIMNNLAVNNGFGEHAQTLGPQLTSVIIKWAFLGQMFGIFGAALARMAFTMTLLALLSPQQRIQLWLLRGLFFVQLVLNLGTGLFIPLQCQPSAGLWDHSIPAKCLPPYVQAHLGFVTGSINSFSDAALAIFPGTIIWKLNMKLSIKIPLCITMSLGVFAMVASIIKAVNLTEIDSDPMDLPYIMFGLQFWFCIENTTLIVAATIPTLRPLLSRRQSVKTPHSGSGPSAYGQGRSAAWRFHKRPTETTLPSTDSGYVELTGRQDLEHGSKTDTQYLVTDRTSNKAPGTGIVRTIETKVAY